MENAVNQISALYARRGISLGAGFDRLAADYIGGSGAPESFQLPPLDHLEWHETVNIGQFSHDYKILGRVLRLVELINPKLLLRAVDNSAISFEGLFECAELPDSTLKNILAGTLRQEIDCGAVFTMLDNLLCRQNHGSGTNSVPELLMCENLIEVQPQPDKEHGVLEVFCEPTRTDAREITGYCPVLLEMLCDEYDRMQEQFLEGIKVEAHTEIPLIAADYFKMDSAEESTVEQVVSLGLKDNKFTVLEALCAEHDRIQAPEYTECELLTAEAAVADYSEADFNVFPEIGSGTQPSGGTEWIGMIHNKFMTGEVYAGIMRDAELINRDVPIKSSA